MNKASYSKAHEAETLVRLLRGAKLIVQETEAKVPADKLCDRLDKFEYHIEAYRYARMGFGWPDPGAYGLEWATLLSLRSSDFHSAVDRAI